ncbi:MAG TPA: ABC transporter ATP-binding protein [Armatimonadota bacterium]|jgi:ABC-2 type transport system ATP-binding protein
MPLAIEIEGLTKRYRATMGTGSTAAVDNLSLQVDEGVIFGFLGPNGAGKTTTIKMLLGLIFPTAGSARILGKKVGNTEVKRLISYLPESPYFYEHLSGQELLQFYGKLFGLSKRVREEKINQLLATVGLPRDRKPLREYSKGMLQRIGIAQALINDPKVLFFDEPTSGLDPIAHIDIRDLILDLKRQGKTIFLSSHQLSDVEMVCDQVAILNRGRLMKVGRVEDLLSGSEIEVAVECSEPAVLSKLEALASRKVPKANVELLYHHNEEVVAQMVDIIRSSKARLISVIPQRRSLEAIFLETVRQDKPGAAPQSSSEVGQ